MISALTSSYENKELSPLNNCSIRNPFLRSVKLYIDPLANIENNLGFQTASNKAERGYTVYGTLWFYSRLNFLIKLSTVF